MKQVVLKHVYACILLLHGMLTVCNDIHLHVDNTPTLIKKAQVYKR